MRGHEALTALRLSGYRPEYVWVFLTGSECWRSYPLDAELTLELSGMPEIHIGPEEVIGSLDFRVLRGVTVLLQGAEDERLRDAFARIRVFAPKRIITANKSIFHDTGERNER